MSTTIPSISAAKKFRPDQPMLTASSKFSWARFSPDALRNIMHFLPPEAVAGCERVCCAWKRTIDFNGIVWKKQCEIQNVTSKCPRKNYKLEFADPRPSIAFGREDWERIYGTVGEVPKLPYKIHRILSSRCLFWRDKTVAETHVLVLVPAAVDGRQLTEELLKEMSEHPKHGPVFFLFLMEDVQPVIKSHWILMPKELVPGTRIKLFNEVGEEDIFDRQNYHSRVKVLKKYSQYDVPYTMEVILGAASEYLKTGKRDKLPFGFDVHSLEADERYTACQEESEYLDTSSEPFRIRKRNILIGCFEPNVGEAGPRLRVHNEDTESEKVGLCAVRRFF